MYSDHNIRTQWICCQYDKPLNSSNVFRVDHGRTETCIEEHVALTYEYLGCGIIEWAPNVYKMPNELKIYLCTRAAQANQIKKNAKRKAKTDAVIPHQWIISILDIPPRKNVGSRRGNK